MNLLFINRSYHPDIEATGQLLTELCEDLASEFNVTVICGRPVRVMDGSPAPTGISQRKGVTIRRVWHTQFSKTSFVGRVINMLTFTVMASWSAFTAPRPDTVITETDPPFLCLLGYALKRIRGVRLICYLQDIYPDIAVALGKLRDGWIAKWLRAAFFGVYRNADQVIVLSRDMRDLMIERDVPAEKVAIIPNWVDTDVIFPVKENNRFRHQNGWEDKFVVMYSGNMGLSQNLSQILDVANCLRDREDIVFAMVGDGADRANLESCAAELQLTNVEFYDYQPKSELAISLSAADLQIVILRPEVQRLLMPSKLYGALASGTACLALADPNTELGETIIDNACGEVLAPHTSTTGIARQIEEFVASCDLATMGSSARDQAATNFHRPASTASFAGTLQQQTLVRQKPKRLEEEKLAARS